MKELTLKELQLCEIDILNNVHHFCLQNNIRYSLYGGTALGAVRHAGFIPWDDDIDIVMPRPDYEYFRRIYKSTRYQLVDRRDDKDSLIAFARVCDNERTMSKSNNPWHKKTNGVWIDIFPADGYDSKDIELYKICLKLYKEILTYRSAYCDFDKSKGLVFNLKLIAKKIIYRDKADVLLNQLITKCTRYKFGDVDSWAVLCCPYEKRTIHPIESFKNIELVKFDDNKYYLLNGYDIMLSNVYGDYMQLPPIEKRIPPMRSLETFFWK